MSHTTYNASRNGDRISVTLHDRRRAYHHLQAVAQNLIHPHRGEVLVLEHHDKASKTARFRVEHAPIEVTGVYVSDVDGALVVQIDTEPGAGRVRIFLNDGTVYDADPERD